MFGTRDKVAVRIATASDAPAVRRVNEMAPRPWSDAKLAKFLASPTRVVYVATVSGVNRDQVAGFAAALLRPQEVRLVRLVTDPPFRRRGVATALLAALERRLVGNRESCDATAPESAVGLQLFLKARGYVCWAEYRDYLESPTESSYEFVKYRHRSAGRDDPFMVVSRDGLVVRERTPGRIADVPA